jgi:hypothetical protein
MAFSIKARGKTLGVPPPMYIVLKPGSPWRSSSAARWSRIASNQRSCWDAEATQLWKSQYAQRLAQNGTCR